MLLVVDVGNTNTVLGVFDGERLDHRFRVQTEHGRTADEAGVMMKALFGHAGISAPMTGAIISCVVPDVLATWQRTITRWFGVESLVVGPGIRTGLPILADNPREVGADRIVNAVAAWEKYRSACVVVDFGTATTFDCVSERGQYMGGVIAPGFQISAEALVRRTSKLPKVELERPPRVIGRNTVHSMQSGLFWGYVSLVDGVVERVIEEMALPQRPRVLATGGLASLVAAGARSIEEVDDDLTLVGLRILFDRNRG